MSETTDWPDGVPKPPLPSGYEWVCLRPALGIGEAGEHPWWVRLARITRNGRRRYVRAAGLGTDDFHRTAEEAIGAAMEAANGKA